MVSVFLSRALLLQIVDLDGAGDVLILDAGGDDSFSRYSTSSSRSGCFVAFGTARAYQRPTWSIVGMCISS